jgi:formate/nitrite transporter
MTEFRFDALLPAEMATRAEYLGVRKAEMPFLKMFMLAILAGAFISLGAIFSTTVGSGTIGISSPDGDLIYSASLPYGFNRLLTGFVFSLGLILVIVGGAELFTGNNLIVMAWASGKVRFSDMIWNWVIVYVGNFFGSFGTALLMFTTRQYTFGGGAVGVAALNTGVFKCSFDFIQALALGIMCNTLVCLAVWLSFSARSTIDRIASILFPITAFVAAGFEHSVANMYFIPYALLIKYGDSGFLNTVSQRVPNLERLTLGDFLLKNLVPVTIGNMVGGAVLVAAVYWAIFLRKQSKA